jgi:hypothetical protein
MALAYDDNRQRAVLHGGYNYADYFADTWEWDGEAWTQMADTGPVGRSAHAAAFDSKRQHVVLYGGIQATQMLHDTWVWDGGDWTQEEDAGPTARFSHNLAYDPTRDRVVLFGGAQLAEQYSYLNDTWEWNGQRWSRVSDIGPKSRSQYGIAYNSEYVLLFGGMSGTETFGDTWAWNGQHWTPIQDIGPGQR